MLHQETLIDVLRAGIWAAFIMCMPVLVVALVVGLIVGLLQALTSIQEMTLTFVPKFAAIFVVLWMTAGMLGRTVTGYFDAYILPMITGI